MRYLFIILTNLLLLSSNLYAAETPMAHAANSTTVQQVKLETSEGDIVIELDLTRAPGTVLNFTKYVESGFYDGTIFHRIIQNFMIQAGGFTPELERKDTNIPIMNEADNGLKNLRGTIAMARTFDPHSASTQFFINVKDNPDLDHTSKTPRGWGYAVFGQVVKGMDVVDKIRNQPTAAKGPFASDVPIKTILIHKASLVGADTTPKK